MAAKPIFERPEVIYDVIIIGAGPAGLSASAALRGAGLVVATIDPNIYGKWKNNYGLWVDEIPAKILDCCEHLWPSASASFDQGTMLLDRAYARLNNGALKQRWMPQHHRFAALATSIEPDGAHTRVVTPTASLTGCLVLDARGAPRTSKPIAQTAYGIRALVDGKPLDFPMVLMDWRGNDGQSTPSFLYGMEFPDGSVFLEETVLCARPPVSIRELKRRLYTRLSRMGVEVREVLREERCFIPMDVPISKPSRVIAFGAAAGFVHPATGYSVARSFSAAEELATHLAANWTPDFEELSQSAWQTLWTDRRRNNHKLYKVGLEVVRRLDPEKVPDFFYHFFQCTRSLWASYLSDSGSPGDAARLMWRVFRNVDVDLKFQLACFASMATVLPRDRP